MASTVTIRRYLLLMLIFCTVILSSTSGDDDYEPEVGPIGKHPSHEGGAEDGCHDGGGEERGHEGGDADHDSDPAHIVDAALLCFHQKRMYSSCDESCRLSARGDLHIPPDQVDEFCNGPCFEETNLVLDCLDGIMGHFLFYNHATTQDVRDTILAGCGHGHHRGDFDVGEHIEADEGSGSIGSEPQFSLLSLTVITVIWHILAL